MTQQVFGVITLFPEIFSVLEYGVTGKILARKLTKLLTWNLRDWALPYANQVDDKPYGGGPGMVLKYQPLNDAILHAKKNMPALTKCIYLSPQGKTIKQKELNAVVEQKTSLLFIAGRYEGIDERIIEQHIDEEWSIGEFVLTGGELAALAFIDGIFRLLPEGLGHPDSALQDSFMHGLLDCPHFTRPAIIENKKVPEVLLSGNHQQIEQWRRKQALGITWLKRPDLLNSIVLNDIDKKLLVEYKQEHSMT